MAFVAEAFVSKIIEQLIAVSSEQLTQEVRLVMGVEEEVEKLTKNFLAIQAVLTAAEQKQLKEKSIKVWLDDLREISYELDDVLDKWRSAMLTKSHGHATTSSRHTTRKVSTFGTSCCFNYGKIGHRHDIARKIKYLNEKLNEIADRRQKYSLKSSDGVGERAREVVQERTTISYIDTTEVKGRVEDEKKIINMLLSGCSSSNPQPQIISIVGIGGLGKTTLAQLGYNNASVTEYFDERIWVCVSDVFDEFKIANAILESLNASGGSEMQTMVRDIIGKLRGKKFLLVLDDVWNEDKNKWRNLGTVLKCGSSESRILVITRKDTVAKNMDCVDSNIVRPKELSTEECWSIICNEVLSEKTVEDLQQWKDIGIQIARKCKGLPLSAKVLGGLLCSKDFREWLSVLASEMWELGEAEADIENHLFAPLCLSYLDLSPVERQCLSYCVFFPKDYIVLKDDLIKMWMAQGYFKDTETRDMEMVAEQVFRNLSARSFFQDFKKDGGGKIFRLKMHDIVHDFVLFISKKECLSSADIKDIKNETIEGYAKSLHHLFVLSKSMDEFRNFIFSFKKLRTLNVSSCKGLDLRKLFKELTCLRSLYLSDCGITEIPPEIGKLIHLRLLDISKNKLREFPETIGLLSNLLILNIRGFYKIRKLPRRWEKQSNLRYLLTDDGIGVYLTEGVGRFHTLREATFLVKSEECSLEYLKNMNHLNSVSIILERKVKHVNGAKQAQLNLKKDLVTMSLRFTEGDYEEEYGTERDDEEVLEALQPCSTLETLMIHGYLGANRNPSWLLSLQHLRMLKLRVWKNCECLPPLGKLPSLANLELLLFVKVKKVGVEFLGIDAELSSDWAFPKLKFLYIYGFGEWEEWDMDDRVHSSVMPCLTTLGITYCEKLKAIPDHLLQKTTLKDLDITCSSLLIERYRKQNGVGWPKLSHIPHVYTD